MFSKHNTELDAVPGDWRNIGCNEFNGRYVLFKGRMGVSKNHHHKCGDEAGGGGTQNKV